MAHRSWLGWQLPQPSLNHTAGEARARIYLPLGAIWRGTPSSSTTAGIKLAHQRCCATAHQRFHRQLHRIKEGSCQGLLESTEVHYRVAAEEDSDAIASPPDDPSAIRPLPTLEPTVSGHQ